MTDQEVAAPNDDVRGEITRIKTDLAQLHAELDALKHQRAEETLKEQINQRIRELEADLRLSELEAEMAKDQQKKAKRHRPFGG